MAPLVYLLPLFLYAPRLIPGTETQAGLIMLATVAALIGSRRGRPRMTLLGLTLFLLWALAMQALAGIAVGLGMLQLLIGPMVLLGLVALDAPPPSRHAMARVCGVLVPLAALELALPSVYSALASIFLDRASVADGHRGISLLTPEPTYASITLLYLLLLAFWSRRVHGQRRPWIEFVLAALLAATLSTYAVLFAAVGIALRWPRRSIAAALSFVLLLPALHSDALSNEDSIRAVVALSRLMASDWSTFLPSLSLLDSSLSSRVLTNVSSFLTPTFAPLGLGLGCGAVPTAFNALGYDFAFDNPVLGAVIEDGCLKPQSYAAALMLGLGWMAVPFVTLLAATFRWALARRRGRTWPMALGLALLLLIVQAQMTNPVPWLLLFIAFVRPPPRRHVRSAVKPADPVAGMTVSAT